MLPGTLPHDQQSRALPQYDRRPSPLGQGPPLFGLAQRRAIELPRPLEPRPAHQSHSSVSESSGTPRHHDAFRGPPTAPLDYRGQGQNLPALRDLFSSQPPTTSQLTYNAPWTPNAGPSPPHTGTDSYHGHTEWHPPLALNPLNESNQSHQAHPVRRLELPILQTSPVATRPPHSLPVSPYNGYPEARDYADVRVERPRQASSASYMPSGVPSPYTSGHDDTPYRSAVASYDRSASVALPPGVPDCQRKYLGTKELLGEGSFHLYEGGFRIPTHVDGEHVNPAWGLTKANKPRKRLALACLDCREKKIKCEPGVSSCLQCEKAKRPCRRAPVQLQNDAAATTGWQGNVGSPGRKTIMDSAPSGDEPESDALCKRRSREEPSPPNVPTKKHRSASPVFSTENIMGGYTRLPIIGATAPEDHSKTLAWEEDPYAVAPETVLHLLDLFFAHFNSATYALFPRGTFTHWARTTTDKCQNERMVLYAVLATGSIFADESLSSFGKHCAQIAKDALGAKLGLYNMCVVQARLLVGIYHFAKESHGADWDYSGSAIRASTNLQLRLNTEEGCLDDAESLSHGRIEFSLTREQLVECKRRTFWSCFILDRYVNGTLCAIAVQDIFLRLPCTEDAYERGVRLEAPFFNNGIIDPLLTILTPASPVSPMAWLALIVAIWGDVLNFSNRAVHRADSAYRDAYEAFYAETHTQLQGWVSRLPDHLKHTDTNIERSIQGGYAGPLISMHALYNFIIMRMNRYVRHAQMPDLTSRNIRAAHYHARELLNMMGVLGRARRDTAQTMEGHRTDFILATPFTGYAIMSAIDVVGAGGLDSNIKSTLDAMSGGLASLRQLARCWNSAREQLKDSERRFYQIQNILQRPFKARSGAWLGREWGMQQSLEREFGLDHDCIYADDGRGDGYTRSYFDALREDVHDRPPTAGLRMG